MTGRLLTERTYAPPPGGKGRPEHYLDYFHGTLAVSPDQQWIVDDGWVWAPAGIPRTWNFRRWIEENPWESEDGPSVRWLCQRWGVGGLPHC